MTDRCALGSLRVRAHYHLLASWRVCLANAEARIAHRWSYIGSRDNVLFTVQQLSRLRDIGYRSHFKTEDR